MDSYLLKRKAFLREPRPRGKTKKMCIEIAEISETVTLVNPVVVVLITMASIIIIEDSLVELVILRASML